MTTALFLLRCNELGVSVADLGFYTIGMIYDMFIEKSNDDYNYDEIATQEDMDRF